MKGFTLVLLSYIGLVLSFTTEDKIISSVQTTPEGATITVFHSTKDLSSMVKNKDIFLKAIKDDCDGRGIVIDSTVSCFCAVMIQNTPRCLCSNMKGDIKKPEDLLTDLLLASGKDRTIVEDEIQSDLRPDVRLLVEFTRLSNAAKSLPNGMSAAAIKENARLAAEALAQQKIDSNAAETKLRELLKKEEKEREELNDRLIARENEIGLLGEGLDAMLDNDLERVERYKNQAGQNAEKVAEIQSLLNTLKQMQIASLTAKQQESLNNISSMRKKFDIDMKLDMQKIEDTVNEANKLKLELENPVFDQIEIDLANQVKKLQPEVDKAKRELDETVSFAKGGKVCRTSLECGSGDQCLHGKCLSISEGSTCVDNSGCGNGQKCSAKHCVAFPEGSPCQTNDACGRSMVCLDNLCMNDFYQPHSSESINRDFCESVIDCNFGELCKHGFCSSLIGAGSISTCKIFSDCPNGYSCNSNSTICDLGAAEGDSCLEHVDCSVGMVCNTDNKCQKIWGGRSGKVDANSYCSATIDCGAGLVCDGNKCASVPDVAQCEIDDECGNSFICLKGACSATSTDCKNHKDCGLNAFCYDNVCVGLYARSDAVCLADENRNCMISNDCAFLQRCAESHCVNVENESLCNSNIDCGNGQSCLKHQCITLPSENICIDSNDCGVGYSCGQSICNAIFADTIFNETSYVCEGNMHCPVNQKCIGGHCSEVKITTCALDSECGNGEKCFSETCISFPEESPCALTADCGNAFACISGKCKSETCDRSNRNSTDFDIPLGSFCKVSSDCGKSQTCFDGECKIVDVSSPCKIINHCGNGMRCMEDKCTLIPDGYPCGEASVDCGLNQMCATDKKYCLRAYGSLFEADILARARDDVMMNNKWEKAVQSRIDGLEHMVEKTLQSVQDSKVGTGSDLVRSVEDLNAERAKLESGRKVLEEEIERRAKLKFNAGSSEGCTLCRAEEDIKKLVDEVNRLQDELKQCIERPSDYIVTCQDDLQYQIDRLNEEILRRRALLEEEIRSLNDNYERISAELDECRLLEDGCATEDEQSFLLQMKRISDELYMREKRIEEGEKLVIYSCLWKFKSEEHIDQINDLMVSFEEGCPKLKEFKMDDIYTCMCSDWEGVSKIRKEASLRAAKAQAMKELVNNNMIVNVGLMGSKVLDKDSNNKKLNPSFVVRDQSVKVAEEVAKELLWKHMKNRAGFEKLLKESISSQEGLIKGVSKEEQEKIEMIENCMKDKNCFSKISEEVTGKRAKVKVFSEEKLSSCLSLVKDPFIIKNLKEKNEKNGESALCAELEMSSTSSISNNDLYSCFCNQ